MTSTVSFVIDTTAPLLDHVGVELARRRHAAHRALVSENPSVPYAMLARARHQSESTSRRWVRRMRQAGDLVTVEYGTTLIPSFQFDNGYNVVPQVSKVLHTLTESGMSAWAVWHWFCTESPWLGDKPARLVERGEFGELERLVQRFLASTRGG